MAWTATGAVLIFIGGFRRMNSDVHRKKQLPTQQMWKVSDWPSQSLDLNPIEQHLPSWRGNFREAWEMTNAYTFERS